MLLVATAALILLNQERIEGLTGIAAILIYLISALVPALLLFGLFRNVARITGKLFGIPIELGGPAALFFIILLFLMNVAPPETRPETRTDTSTTTTTARHDTTDTTTPTITNIPYVKRSPPLPKKPDVATHIGKRWKTTIKAHGTPQENAVAWLDGRYTAYIKDEPNGAVTSDPPSTASHLGYVVDIPKKASYRVTARYAAATNRPVNVFTAPDIPHNPGEDIFGPSKRRVQFHPTPSPVLPQTGHVAILDLEPGRNVIDLRAASAAGLPNLFSLTIEALDDPTP